MLTIITNMEKLRMHKISNNFFRSEFRCRCECGFATVDTELLKVLEVVRKRFNQPIKINSGCRCVKYNKYIGGTVGSKHLQGIAADIVVKNVSPDDVYLFLDSYMPNSYGLGKYKSFTHIDVRPIKARW